MTELTTTNPNIAYSQSITPISSKGQRLELIERATHNNLIQIPQELFNQGCCSPYPYQNSPENQLTELVSTLAAVVENLINTFTAMFKGLMDKIASNSDKAPTTTNNSAPVNNTTSPTPGTNETKGTSGKTKSSSASSKEFLWKPSSEKDKKLVVLVPAKYTGKIESVYILSSDGKKVLAKGKNSGTFEADNREIFRFSKAGSKYADNCIVEIKLKNGQTQQITIPETSRRLTRK
jgi:hypothetical protein